MRKLLLAAWLGGAGCAADAPSQSPILDAAVAEVAPGAETPPSGEANAQVDVSAVEVGAGEAEDAGEAGQGAGRTPAAAFAGPLNADSFAPVTNSWSRALAIAGDVVVTANPESDSITVLDAAAGALAVRREVAVGRDPRTVALTSDARYAVVVNRGDATVSVVDVAAGRELFYFETGPLPYGVVVAGGRLFVSEWATGHVSAYDPVARMRVGRAVVAPFPAGLAHCGPPACALAGGRGLLVTHFYSGRLSVLHPQTLAIVAQLSTGADTNLSQHVALAPDGRRAYLPQTRSFADNPIRQFDTTVFPVVNVVDLATLTLLNGARITLDTADRPVAFPFSVDFLPGDRLVTANAASDDLSIVDLTTGFKVAHIDVGANPQAVAVSRDGQLLVNQVLDGSLRVLPDTDPSHGQVVPLTSVPLAPQLLRGKKLFWSAARVDLARDKWMACATCHFDGFHDARTWRSFPDGVRNTTALFDLAQTAPFHWSGDLDEIEDVEATIRFIQAGKGLAPAPQIDTLGAPLADASADLTALGAFLRTLRPPVSPYLDDPAAISRGRTAFDRLACTSCHAGAHFTDRRNHDVGTGDPTTERNSHGRGLSFDTPSLRALWLTAPYLHDGSAATLNDVFQRGAHDLRSKAEEDEVADLVTYLRSL